MEIIVDYSRLPVNFWYMKKATDESIQNVDNSPSRFPTGTGVAPIKQDKFARYRALHREELKIRRRERYYAELEKNRAYFRNWQAEARAKNPELIEKVKKWNRDHPEAHRKHVKDSKNRNIESRREYENDYWRKRMNADLNVRLRRYIRSRMSCVLRGKIKSGSTMVLLGCSIENLWIYLESKFHLGMTRENYAKYWEVDHIIPLASFDLSQPDHQKRAFHFSNLQPLTLAENRSKGAKQQTTNRKTRVSRST